MSIQPIGTEIGQIQRLSWFKRAKISPLTITVAVTTMGIAFLLIALITAITFASTTKDTANITFTDKSAVETRISVNVPRESESIRVEAIQAKLCSIINEASAADPLIKGVPYTVVVSELQPANPIQLRVMFYYEGSIEQADYESFIKQNLMNIPYLASLSSIDEFSVDIGKFNDIVKVPTGFWQDFVVKNKCPDPAEGANSAIEATIETKFTDGINQVGTMQAKLCSILDNMQNADLPVSGLPFTAVVSHSTGGFKVMLYYENIVTEGDFDKFINSNLQHVSYLADINNIDSFNVIADGFGGKATVPKEFWISNIQEKKHCQNNLEQDKSAVATIITTNRDDLGAATIKDRLCATLEMCEDGNLCCPYLIQIGDQTANRIFNVIMYYNREAKWGTGCMDVYTELTRPMPITLVPPESNSLNTHLTADNWKLVEEAKCK